MFCHIIRIVKVNHINELFSHLSPTTGLSWRYYRPHPSGWWDVAVYISSCLDRKMQALPPLPLGDALMVLLPISCILKVPQE